MLSSSTVKEQLQIVTLLRPSALLGATDGQAETALQRVQCKRRGCCLLPKTELILAEETDQDRTNSSREYDRHDHE